MDEDLPADIPVLTHEHQVQMENWTKQYADEPTFPTGTLVTCPTCGKRTLVYTNDLSVDVPQRTGVQTITHLPGAECSNCGTRAYSAGAQKHLLLARSRAPRLVQETKVSRLGGKQPGLYFTQVIQQLTGVEPGEEVRIYITDEGDMFLEFPRKGRSGTSEPGAG